MNRTVLVTISIIFSALLVWISLHNFGVIYNSLLARLLAEPATCSRDFSSLCYSEQYFEANLSKGKLFVGGQELALKSMGNTRYQVGDLETYVLIPTEANTNEGKIYFGLDFSSFIEQSMSEDMCIKGRFLNLYKHDDITGVAMPYAAGDNVLELSLCSTSSYPPSVFSENLLNGTN